MVLHLGQVWLFGIIVYCLNSAIICDRFEPFGRVLARVVSACGCNYLQVNISTISSYMLAGDKLLQLAVDLLNLFLRLCKH